MKKIYIFLTGMIFLVSCSQNFIDLNPPSSLNSLGFYKTQTDLNQAVLSAYGNLRSVYNSTFVNLGEIRSDNSTYSWLAGNPANEKGVDDFASPLLPENSYPTSAWDNCYNVIMRCNIVIGRAGNATFSNEELRNQYVAEAKFIRALMYFWLNRVFGGNAINGQLLGVIKVDKEISQVEAYAMERASLQEIYDLTRTIITLFDFQTVGRIQVLHEKTGAQECPGK